MDAREVQNDLEEALRALVESEQAKTWTSAVGTIVRFDAAKQTATIQLAVKGQIKTPDGKQKTVDLPLLEDVPVQFPGGGGTTLTFPVKPGDEVLVNFTSQSPDGWQQSGGQQAPASTGRNGLSNGFAQLGFRSNPRALGNVDTSGAQLRSDDGKTTIGLSSSGGISIKTDKGVAIESAGDVTVTGTLKVSGDVIAGTISLKEHIHSGVVPGGGNTAQPVP